MCGVAGILDLSTGDAPRRAALEAMVECIDHRGPDSRGFYNDARIGLGHARLSIIDIDGGRQPIHNEDKTVWVVFNGEIFNHVELRPRLESQGHRFQTRTDTEVIVHLYEQYGDEFVHHLNGQFALALWDVRRSRLVLARDRTGIRPLFHVSAAGRLYFASEVKALFACPEVPRRLCPRALAQIFTYWSPLPPQTAFEGIEALPPGHYMVVENGRARITRYWDWRFPSEVVSSRRSVEDCADDVRDLLVDAVRLQLRADVPVGAYLSGGLDSSVITALIKHFTDVPLRTFSLTFEDGEFDESGYQEQLVRELGTNHTSLRCSKNDICAAFPKTIWHAETPIVRTAPTPLMLLAERVRAEGFKVVLTGEGADEVFAGYDLFKEAKIRRFCARKPGSSHRPRLLGRLYPYLKNSPASRRAFAERFFLDGSEHQHRPVFAHMPRWATTRRIWRFFSGELAASVADWNPLDAIEAWLPSEVKDWLPLGRDQYLEAHTLLSGYLLSSQGDRMSMAHSIEGRYPFLDHRLIEYANSLPAHYKMRGLTEKYVLKSAMRGLLPEAIRLRTKQPYRAPDSASFFADSRPADYVAALLEPQRIRRSGYFEPSSVAQLLEKCRRGQAIGFADNMAFVGVLSTMLVDAMFVSRDLSVDDVSRTVANYAVH